MTEATANAEQARYWADHAPTWLEIEQTFEEVGGPLGRLAMDRLPLRPGLRVLDVGCGSGGTTLNLAERVAPGGQVVGVDIAAVLVDHARERAAAAGVDAVTFVQGDAQVHDLGQGAFDAAFSRFGVMFFDDPVAAFANIRRALRPGAPLSFVCWQGVLCNEWVLVPAMAAMGVLGTAPAMPDPQAPGPFALADPDRVRTVLTDAGFGDVEVVPHRDVRPMEESRIPDLAVQTTRLGAVRDMVEGVDENTRARVVAAIEAALRERAAGGAVTLARAVHLVTARA